MQQYLDSRRAGVFVSGWAGEVSTCVCSVDVHAYKQALKIDLKVEKVLFSMEA